EREQMATPAPANQTDGWEAEHAGEAEPAFVQPKPAVTNSVACLEEKAPIVHKQHRDEVEPPRHSWRTLGRLLQFVWPYKWWALVALFLGIGTVASNIGLMGTSGYLIAKAALRPENV